MARTVNSKVELASQLAYPVYLDTEMLVSFLASLEDGVSYSSEIAEHSSAAKDREGEGSGKVSLPSIATLLGLTLSAEGRYKRRSSAEEGVESKFVREHTAASLFNRLRLRLAETPGAITPIASADALSGLATGSLVDIQGEVIGNPLKQVLDLLAAIGPYFGLEIDESVPSPPRAKPQPGRPSKGGGPGRGAVPQLASLSGQPATEPTIQDLLRVLKREVERSSVLDLLLEGHDGVKVVLTVSRELLTPEVEAYLIGGRFNAIGKVSAILDAGQSINLIRRTVFGFGGRQFADEMFGNFNSAMQQSGGMGLSLAQAVIDGPALQIMPLAIYLLFTQEGQHFAPSNLIGANGFARARSLLKGLRRGASTRRRRALDCDPER